MLKSNIAILTQGKVFGKGILHGRNKYFAEKALKVFQSGSKGSML
jgi:hypothetical protein